MKEISLENLKKHSNSIQSNLQFYNTIGQPLVDEYCKDLDEKVAAISSYVSQIRALNLEFDVPSLQRICMELSSVIYYTNDKYEKMSLLEDMARKTYKDKYNEVYLSKQGKAKLEDRDYTKDQLKALADQESIEEELIHFIYQHAAGTIKSKIESAQELLKSCSKSLSGCIESMKQFNVGGTRNL
jgi:hypothetical protein